MGHRFHRGTEIQFHLRKLISNPEMPYETKVFRMILSNRLEKCLKTHSLSEFKTQFGTEDIQQSVKEFLKALWNRLIAEELLMLRLVLV